MTQRPEPSHRDRLEAARDRLAAVLRDPETSPRDVAGVSREYRLLLDRLAEMTPGTGSSPLDEIAARRQERGAS